MRLSGISATSGDVDRHFLLPQPSLHSGEDAPDTLTMFRWLGSWKVSLPTSRWDQNEREDGVLRG